MSLGVGTTSTLEGAVTRPATFTEANAWVNFYTESFTRHLVAMVT